jgi:hypothetical protein
MWPFRRKEKIEYLPAGELNFTQVDVTERFDDHLSLSKDEWVETVPINKFVEGRPENLPAVDASEEEVYRIASELSRIRESFRVASDGVYCPICHIANVDIENLRTPCPRCRLPLLAFGWK